MLPSNQRSIFHLGEEGGDGGHRGVIVDHHCKNSIDIHRHLGGPNNGRRQRRGRDAGADVVVVGLQILVQHQHRHHTQPCHVVLKQMICPPAARHRFLRACSLCRRELSSNREVYMYRGDQGFCSECRRQQILTDQAREREAMVVKRNRPGLPHHRRHHGQRLLLPAIVGAPRRSLAVA